MRRTAVWRDELRFTEWRQGQYRSNQARTPLAPMSRGVNWWPPRRVNDVELPGPPSQPSHAAPAVTDLLAGQVQVLFTGAPALLPHIRAGKMRTLASPELRTHFASEGAEPAPATPQAFGRLIASELARWRKVVKGAQIKAE